MAQLSAYGLRQNIRNDEFISNNSGFAHGWASDFLQFCQFNPKLYPLIGMSANTGGYILPDLGESIEIRTDVLGYRLFEHGELN